MAEIVYVCQIFPWVTQTFTVREVSLLREQGLDISVASFRRPPEQLMDAEGRALLAHTTFVPRPLSAAFLRAALRAARRRPLTFLRLALSAFVAPGLVHTSWRMRLRGALAVARGAWIADRHPRARLFHAEFPDEAATAAMAAGELTGTPFSFKSHASFNPQQLARKAARAAFVATESAFTRRHYFADVGDDRALVNRGGVRLPVPDLPRAPAVDELRILSVGTLQEKKGHRFLVDALRLLREREVAFHCLIVGSGPLEGELRAAIDASDLADSVTLEPYRTHDEVLRLYAEHDVFALPCIVTDDGDRDGIPAVLIEAGAAGCALVSTAVSGIPELVEDGATGLLVGERDAAGLADALERLAAEPELRRELSLGVQARVQERFDLGRNTAALAERFRQELGRVATARSS